MTGRRAVPGAVPPAFRLPCRHYIPVDAVRFLELWPGEVEILCKRCGVFRPVERTLVATLVVPPTLI